MRIAALYDVHGALPALDAVLAEVEAEPFDLVVVGGDVVSGPRPVEVLERLRGLALPTRWVMGNADRLVAAGVREHPDDAIAVAALGDEERAFLRTFEPTVAVDGVLFCHASPRSDEEWIAPEAPPELLREMFAGVGERLIVGGHTHRHLVLEIDAWRYVNAGSVAHGGSWLAVVDGEPTHRVTSA